MSKPKICCVVPSVRPDCHEKFLAAWTPLFTKHDVTLITVWDGEEPRLEERTAADGYQRVEESATPLAKLVAAGHGDLICRRTDACRNLGFLAAAVSDAEYVLTLDDDVVPCAWNSPGMGPVETNWKDDPIQAHLDVLQRRVPLGWMNTAHDTDLYLRGVPYHDRAEAPVMLSHGVWVGVPDFDGETQLDLESKGPLPFTLPYYVGPIPRGVLFPLCGMNVMIRREALPHLYYAPMGADSGVPDLHRFADIFMGVFLKRTFDELGWACYTGGATILHTRASDARKNFEQEKLGREWIEHIETYANGISIGVGMEQAYAYFRAYAEKRERYAALVKAFLEQA